MLDDQNLKKLWKEFKRIGQTALFMSHYDLARESQINDSHLWKLFLMEPEVADWITSEIQVLQKTELKKMIKDIGDSNSVGKAQLINVLSKLNEDHKDKEGPVFIYSYVPLSEEQKKAENVQILEHDPFIK